MKWVEIKGTHINTNQIETFYWKDGELRIWFRGDYIKPTTWEDPDQELYLKLCRQQGIRPVMEDSHE